MAPALKLPPGAQLVDDSSSIKLPPGAELVSDAPDFSAPDNNTEGLYEMKGKDGKTKKIPFSKVLDAGKAGFSITPEDFKRFTKDYKHTQGFRAEMDSALSPSEESTWSGRGLNVIKGTASGLVSPFSHPIQTALSMGESVVASGMAPGGMYPIAAPTSPGQYAEQKRTHTTPEEVQVQAQKLMQPQAEEAAKHPVYAVSSFVGPALLVHGLAKVAPSLPEIPGVSRVKEFVSQTPEAIRKGLRNKFGGGSDFTANKVEQFANENEKARAGMKAADELGEAKRGTVEAVNDERNAAHKDRLDDHQEKIQKQKEEHAEKVAKWEGKKANLLKEHQDQVKETQAENQKAHNDWFKQVEDVAKENQAIDGVIDQRQAVEKAISDSETELQRRADAAEVKAKADNDAIWNKWRDKVKDATVDMNPVVSSIKAQEASMNPQQVAEFRDMLRETKPDTSDLSEQERTRNEIMKGQGYGTGTTYDDLPPERKAVIDKIMSSLGIEDIDPTAARSVPASRLHGWKTQLERAVRRAQDGNVRYAIGQVLDRVRAAEDDVSKEVGADKELKEARASHGPYVEAFRNSPNEPSTAKSAVLKKFAKNATEQKHYDELLSRLGHYDPEIPKIAESAEKLREQLDGLPKPGRKGEAPPQPIPKPLPVYPDDALVEAKIGERPKEPDYKKPPKAPSQKPYGEPVKYRHTIPAAEDWTPERINAMRSSLQKYGATGAWVWRLIVGSSAEVATDMLVHGAGPESVGHFASSILIGQGALKLFSNILRNESVLKWMAKPSAEDMRIIDTLPPQDAVRVRAALKGLATDEQNRNPQSRTVTISPALSAFLAGAAASQPKKQMTPEEVRKRAEEMQKQAPDGQSSVAPYHTHVYDESSGQILPV